MSRSEVPGLRCSNTAVCNCLTLEASLEVLPRCTPSKRDGAETNTEILTGQLLGEVGEDGVDQGGSLRGLDGDALEDGDLSLIHI